jgi:uncharacterized protein (DUF433 family)
MTDVSSSAMRWPNQRLYLPAYRFADAARLARTTPQSVTRWFRGYSVPGHRMEPVLPMANGGTIISYLQLVEAAFVASFRYLGVDLDRLRRAHRYLRERFDIEHPFAAYRFATDGVHVLTQFGEEMVAVDQGGQLAMAEVIRARAAEFDYEDGLALRWRPRGPDSVVLVDPRIAFGAPSVQGVPTSVLKERSRAGEAVDEIAEDYDLPPSAVLAALDFEGVSSEAA